MFPTSRFLFLPVAFSLTAVAAIVTAPLLPAQEALPASAPSSAPAPATAAPAAAGP